MSTTRANKSHVAGILASAGTLLLVAGVLLFASPPSPSAITGRQDAPAFGTTGTHSAMTKEVRSAYYRVQFRRSEKWVVFDLVDGVFEKAASGSNYPSGSDQQAAFNDFKDAFPNNQCRYGVFDMDTDSAKGGAMVLVTARLCYLVEPEKAIQVEHSEADFFTSFTSLNRAIHVRACAQAPTAPPRRSPAHPQPVPACTRTPRAPALADQANVGHQLPRGARLCDGLLEVRQHQELPRFVSSS